jgi:hypothetical protein
MATVTTYDLIQCSRLYPTLQSRYNNGLSAYNGLIVRFDNDNDKSYTIKKRVQGRFYHPNIATVLTDIQYDVTSIKYGGVEQLDATASLNLTESENNYIKFPLYTLGNEYTYTDNLANACAYEDGILADGHSIRNLSDFLQGLFNTLGLNHIIVTRSHPDWWMVDGKPRLVHNFLIEKWYNEDLDITIEETDSLTSTTRILRYVFDGSTVTAYINGVDVVTTELNTEWPQVDDENSVYNYTYTYDAISTITSCPIASPFQASLQADNCATLEVNCECNAITFTDTSRYENGQDGHNAEFFNFRVITMTKPSGDTYVWSTEDVAGVDSVINPHWDSTNIFQYNLTSADKDGIYTVKLCTYPDWQDDVLYQSFLYPIVYKNGTLYKCIASSTGIDPEADVDEAYWQEYVCTGDCTDTRYCTQERIVILCISLLNCYKSLVREAMCGIDANPCRSMCDNREFMQAMKFRVTLDALEMAVCDGDWTSARRHLEILDSICCCNG